MSWHFTDDVLAYARHATDLLAGDPARNTVALTVLAAVRAGRRWSRDPVLFGWSESGGQASSAACVTPPYELLLATVELSDLESLVDALLARDVTVPGVNGETSVATAFAAAWTRRRGLRSVISRHERLYRLDVLMPPTGVVGRGRVAVPGDAAVAVDWFTRFQVEARARRVAVERDVADRIDGGRLWLWEDTDGRVVSMAGRAATAVGVAPTAVSAALGLRAGVSVYVPASQRRPRAMRRSVLMGRKVRSEHGRVDPTTTVWPAGSCGGNQDRIVVDRVVRERVAWTLPMRACRGIRNRPTPGGPEPWAIRMSGVRELQGAVPGPA